MEAEVEGSQWEVYLVEEAETSENYYHIPGFGTGEANEYFVFHTWHARIMTAYFSIIRSTGPGEVYEEIRIIRTAVNSVNDQRSKAAGLDYSNYEEVVEHFGLNDEGAVRISSP